MELQTSSMCLICGSPDAQYHFGAVACRACAAFFRRFVHSKKSTINCNCNSNNTSRYPCRLCRIKKCLSIGMDTSLVQPPRDPNSPRTLKIASAPGTSKIATMSIHRPIVSRSLDRLYYIQMNYTNMMKEREFYNSESMSSENFNMYALSCMAVNDFEIMSKTLEKIFPEFNFLGKIEKESLFANFYTKWNIVETAMHESLIPSGNPIHSFDTFYTPSKQARLTEKEVIRIFSPYWSYFYNFLIPKITQPKMHNVEYMALLALVFLDSGYSNLSEESVEMCRSLKNVYLKEFQAYYREINFENSDRRFFEILDLLQLLEKGEAKCQEEVEMCFVHGMMINEDYAKLVKTAKN